MTGTGMEEFFRAVAEAAAEFERDYLPDLLREKARREQEDVDRKKGNMTRLMKDMSLEQRGEGGGPGGNVMDVAEGGEGSAGLGEHGGQR